MSIQFATLASFHSYHVGLLRERLLDRYPGISEHGAIAPAFETFGGLSAQEPSLRFEAVLSPPMPRFWFESEAGALMQVQQDRVLHNWRKLEDAQSYPRYETVRAEFEKDVERFEEFLDDLKLGEIKPNQSEISYVNAIELPDERDPQGSLERILSSWRAPSDHSRNRRGRNGAVSICPPQIERALCTHAPERAASYPSVYSSSLCEDGDHGSRQTKGEFGAVVLRILR